jgi:hypothetical protein
VAIFRLAIMVDLTPFYKTSLILQNSWQSLSLPGMTDIAHVVQPYNPS